jgi:hypothetical protein
MSDITLDQARAFCSALERAGISVKTGTFDGDEPEYKNTPFGLRLANGNPEMFLKLFRAAFDPDPEELQRFFVANKAKLNRYRD